MDITRYVNELQHELLTAAAAGGEDARQLAERLVAPLQSATRLVLLDALTAAAAEITSELAPGSVEVRLRNREPEFVVTTIVETPDRPARPGEREPAEVPPYTADGDDAATARITLRLPDALKVRVDEAAGRSGLSVNAWLVRTLGAAVNPSEPRPAAPPTQPMGGQRFTGWARS